MKRYMGDFSEMGAAGAEVQPDLELTDHKGNSLQAEVKNGTLVIKEAKPEFTYKKTFVFGDEDDDIKVLQERLMKLGYYNDAIDGIFGFQTMMAIKSFQRQAGLEPNGKINSLTFNELMKPSAEAQVENIKTENNNKNKKILLGVGAIAAAYLMTKE